MLNKKNIENIVKKNTNLIYKKYAFIRPFIIKNKKNYLEKKNMVLLITSWLYLEKKRKQNFFIKHIEKNIYFDILKYKLKFRIDRIDSIYLYKQFFIIDYKYSKNFSFSYLIREPIYFIQMVIYYYCLKHKFSSIYYGIIHNKKISFLNIGNDKNLTLYDASYKKSLNWDKIFYFCNKIIVNSLYKYINGNINNFPNKLSECLTCNLHSLCRKYDNNKN